MLHYSRHYSALTNGTNAAAQQAGGDLQNMDLTTLVQRVSELQDRPDVFTAVRNNAGGAWNHALYFRHFAPASSERANPGPSVSAELNNEFDRSFDGDVQEMKVAFTAAANRIFGSGWAWLCYTGEKLVVTTTQNQDNPLMGNLPNSRPVDYAGCTPILSLDLWEHSYYLKHGPARAAHIEDFWRIIDWTQVSRNYAAAKAGRIQSIVE